MYREQWFLDSQGIIGACLVAVVSIGGALLIAYALDLL